MHSIFPRKLSKNCKKNPWISCFCGIYTRVSAINLTCDIALINKPHVVKKFAFLKAAEHCYAAFLPRYKVRPWVSKSNHRNALLCQWKSDSDFWRWVFKVFKRWRKPAAEKSDLENVRFLSWRTFFVGKYGIQSPNEMAFKRTVTIRELSISRHQIWCAHASVIQRMHACACKKEEKKKNPNQSNYHMSIKKSQAILKCFKDLKPSVIGLRWTPCFATLKTFFQVDCWSSCLKHYRQSYILNKFDKSKKSI